MAWGMWWSENIKHIGIIQDKEEWTRLVIWIASWISWIKTFILPRLRVAFHVLRLNHGSAAYVPPAPRAKPKRGAARNAHRERLPTQFQTFKQWGATECYKRRCESIRKIPNPELLRNQTRYLWFHSYKLVPLFFLGPRPQHFLNVTHILAWSFMTFTPNRSRQLRSGPSPRRQVSAANSSRCHSCRQGRYAPSPDGSCSLAFFFEMGQNLWNYPLVI